jgi:cell division protein FtsW (lipid II flippase)
MKERHRQRKLEGMFIPAFILIGIGAGLLFGRPDVGAVVGIGTGFIAMGVAKMINSSKSEATSVLVHSSFPLLIGGLFVIGGFGLVYFPASIWPYFGAIVLIVAGIWFLFRAATRQEVEKTDEVE